MRPRTQCRRVVVLCMPRLLCALGVLASRHMRASPAAIGATARKDAKTCLTAPAARLYASLNAISMRYGAIGPQKVRQTSPYHPTSPYCAYLWPPSARPLAKVPRACTASDGTSRARVTAAIYAASNAMSVRSGAMYATTAVCAWSARKSPYACIAHKGANGVRQTRLMAPAARVVVAMRPRT
jgi:hypothetical protein